MPVTRSIPTVLLLLIAMLVAAGCGGGGSDAKSSSKRDGATTTTTATTDGSSASTAPTGKVAAVPAELQVVLTGIGSKSGAGVPIPARANCTKSIPATCKASITCPAAEGAPAGDLALCTWIAETPTEVLTQPDESAGGVCTQQYGGPEQAVVTGTRDGQPIKVRYSRQDGCAIARWDKASPLWTGEVPASTDGAPQATDPEIITDPIR